MQPTNQPTKKERILSVAFAWEWVEVADHWESYVRFGNEVIGSWGDGLIVCTEFVEGEF